MISEARKILYGDLFNHRIKYQAKNIIACEQFLLFSVWITNQMGPQLAQKDYRKCN
jgi:hypothetical protein